MKAIFRNAWGYQGNALELPLENAETSAAYYEKFFGFSVVDRGSEPNNYVILERDGQKIGLVENGGDPTQDGVAFEVDNVEQLSDEFKASGLEKELSDFSTEVNDGVKWKVFYVVAPDGLCFWFGEKQEDQS